MQFSGKHLVRLEYINKKTQQAPVNTLALKVKNKIEKYLDGRAKEIKIDYLFEATAFQQKVLNQLQKIPYGETRTYGEIAKVLNTSPRAVGNACRNNPLPIIIPCHRVIAANGIGGYAGDTSGHLLQIKRKLLAAEGVYL